MKKYISRCGKNTSAAAVIFLVSVWFLLTSCEQDELTPLKPFDSSCDTISVSFKNMIEPIMINRCQACHNSNFKGGGIDLEGYDLIRQSAADNQLMPSLTGSMSNYIRDNCETARIQAWINQGLKNN